MSQENVEVVRRFMSPHEGEDLVPPMREAMEQLGPDFQPDAVLAWWAKDPGWQHAHPDMEWDASGRGVGGNARGARAVALWWLDWMEGWESYVYRVVEYRDLGDWVLVTVDVRARGRDGVAVEMQGFELHQVREGKVAVHRIFLSEQEALKAVGLEG